LLLALLLTFGSSIPLFGYLLLLYDIPYKHAWTKEEALEHIAVQSGKQFSPILAHIFIKLMRECGNNGEPTFLMK